MAFEWEIGGLYKTKDENERPRYIRVIAIGDEKIFVREFEIERQSPLLTAIRRFFNKSARSRVVINYSEQSKNRFYYAWVEVDKIEEANFPDEVVFQKNYLFNDLLKGVYDRPFEYWISGEEYTFANEGFVILGIGDDTIFARNIDTGFERVYFKSSNWIKK